MVTGVVALEAGGVLTGGAVCLASISLGLVCWIGGLLDWWVTGWLPINGCLLEYALQTLVWCL